MRSLRSPLLPATLVAPATSPRGCGSPLPDPIAWLYSSAEVKGAILPTPAGLVDLGSRLVEYLFSAPVASVEPSSVEDGRVEPAAAAPAPDAVPAHGGGAVAAGGRSSALATVLVILKAFVGGTMLVLPGSMQKTGLLAGNLTLWAVGLLELWCMLKLVEAHRRFGGSFAQLAERAMGWGGAAAVEASILLSQLGFTAAEMIYVAKTGTFALEWAAAHSALADEWFGGLGQDQMERLLIWLQLFVVVPVSWCRDLASLTLFNFAGNALILGAVGAISAVTIEGLSRQGPSGELPMSSPMNQMLIFVGFSVYAFEGITMVVPIYTAHRHKESFPSVLSWTIIGITALFSIFATANVILYGDLLQPILTLNLPRGSRLRMWVSMAFALGSLTLVFLMAFPTYEIIEGRLRKSCGLRLEGGPSTGAVRAVVVCLCSVVARFGGSRLDVFLSLVGAVGCVPLAFIYPGAIHLRLLAERWDQAAGDVAVLVVGLGITISCLAGVF